MRRLRFTLSILGLALAAIPALATITYTSCTSGCGSSSGSYAGMPSANGATGLAFSSPITFVAAGLQGTGVYIDTGIGTGGTGTAFTNYNGSGSVDAQTHVNGAVFMQGANGSNSGFEIDLPANTYAFAMTVSGCAYSYTCTSYSFDNLATVGLGTQPSHTTTYQLTLSTSGLAFFGIVSDSPIASLFFVSGSNSAYLGINSFEIGQESGAPTSEAATFFTMGGGLLGLYFLRRPISFRLRTPIGSRTPLGPQTGVA